MHFGNVIRFDRMWLLLERNNC